MLLHNDDNDQEQSTIVESSFIGEEIYPVGIGNIISKFYQWTLQANEVIQKEVSHKNDAVWKMIIRSKLSRTTRFVFGN